ncbi:monovalent cation/H+ antiporter complex subunit F [Vallitalea okinawensis]|uniref:monovalent cation/H+ antiporter complex subunit F n=1 Tax=Vallitalea okinawensis TaxID=2078660 RepID=UPI000CFAC9FC|nr:monovalent cation/H+ antiporter complex subunit F [Vallitalea okinawensis]
MQTIILLLSFIMIFSLLRLILGPSVWDRLLGLNLMSLKITALIVLFALLNDQNYLLDIALAYALLNIIGLIFISRFIQQKGKI